MHEEVRGTSGVCLTLFCLYESFSDRVTMLMNTRCLEKQQPYQVAGLSRSSSLLQKQPPGTKMSVAHVRVM